MPPEPSDRSIVKREPWPIETAADIPRLFYHSAWSRAPIDCVDTLRSARMRLERHASYADAVRAAVALGDDTDTTAAVVGGIAGLREGIDGIPKEWLDALRGREIVDPLLARTTARR